jgi:hypothetical protein
VNALTHDRVRTLLLTPGASPASPPTSPLLPDPRRTALANRVRGEFHEMPGLSPTLRQAARLFGLRPDECRQILELLVREEFLRGGQDGQYRMR